MQFGVTYEVTVEQLNYLGRRRDRIENVRNEGVRCLGFGIIQPGMLARLYPELEFAPKPTPTVVILDSESASNNDNFLYLKAI